MVMMARVPRGAVSGLDKFQIIHGANGQVHGASYILE